MLVLAHGFSEHSGRYQYFAERLCAAGIAVIALDHRGHGKSPGRRGHINAMADYRGDIGAVINLAEIKWPGIPRVIFGHSMGSLIVLDYVLHHPRGLAGVITSGAGLEPAGIATPLTILAARTLSRIWPTFALPVKVKAADLTRDQQEIDCYNNDPMVHSNGTARWGSEMLKAIEWIKQRSGDLDLPILMMHGTSDNLNLASGSQNFIAGVSFPDKSLYLYPDCLHELHNDLEKEKVLTDLTDWILNHV
uniref:Lysophospholipase n=1 Tax=uncultured bacterium pES01019D12 TaxID=355333 RepID=A0EJL0_9BACT|nr:lysophospholipase [uncultured bacterium pES01019D12]